ncbi:MAG: DUF1499 domain-containing protein [Pseudomonadota bacterium]
MKTVLVIVAVLIIAAIGAMAYMGIQSKSGSAPGLVGAALTPCPDSPNCVSSEADTPSEKKVDALPVSAWAELPAAVAAMGGRVTQTTDAYLAAEFTSKTFKFVDDVEFRLTDDAVHVRSASRVGHSDGGVNAERIATLKTELGL